MNERSLKDHTSLSAFGCLTDKISNFLRVGQDREILERPQLSLQLSEMRSCQGLDDTAGRGLEGGEVFMESIGVILCVEGVESIMLECGKSGVLRGDGLCELLHFAGECELAGEEEALIIGVISMQPIIAVLELPQPILRLPAFLHHPHVLLQEVLHVLRLLTTRQEEVLQRGRLHVALAF